MNRRSFLLAVGAPIFGAGILFGSTWNSFPGAWLKNRLRLDNDKLARSRRRKRDLLARLDWPEPPARVRILIRKASRRLTLYGDDREMLTCRIGLGGEPKGAKRRQGDGRTPEGDYRVCTRNARSQFHLFLGLDYPNKRDAERGLDAGTITRAVYNRIMDAHEHRRVPPWNTVLGGAIGIHGSGASWDWTLGCVALDDHDIETLWSFCTVGTAVRIEP
jgi:hypothetical protein